MYEVCMYIHTYTAEFGGDRMLYAVLVWVSLVCAWNLDLGHSKAYEPGTGACSCDGVVWRGDQLSRPLCFTSTYNERIWGPRILFPAGGKRNGTAENRQSTTNLEISKSHNPEQPMYVPQNQLQLFSIPSTRSPSASRPQPQELATKTPVQP